MVATPAPPAPGETAPTTDRPAPVRGAIPPLARILLILVGGVVAGMAGLAIGVLLLR